MENKIKDSNSTGNLDHAQLFKLLVLIVALLALLFVAYKLSEKSKHDEVAREPQLPQVEKTNVDFSELPEKFPTDIPMEAGVRITQNYNSLTPEGQFQATRVFETSKSLDATIKVYTDFLNNNDWKITATLDQPNLKMVMGSKDGASIQVTVNQNTINDTKTVSISYMESLRDAMKKMDNTSK